MLLRKIKNMLPLSARQKYRPLVAKLPGAKNLLTKPFYEPSNASIGLSRKQAGNEKPIIQVGELKPIKKLDPHFSLNFESTSLNTDHGGLILILGSAMFTKHVFSYHTEEANNTIGDRQISAVQNYKGDKHKLRKILMLIIDEGYLDLYKTPKITVYVDLTDYFRSVDPSIKFSSLREVFEEFKDIKAEVVFLTSTNSKEKISRLRKKRLPNLTTRTMKVSPEQAICLRTSNTFLRSTREYRNLLGVGSPSVLVLGWRELLKRPEKLHAFINLAKKHPTVHFDIFEPIWNIPLNAKTDIYSLPENCSIRGDLGYKSIYTAGGFYDLVYCLNGEFLVQHERGKLVILNLLLQGLKIIGDVQDISDFVETTSAKDLCKYIESDFTSFDSQVYLSNLQNIEQHLAAVLKCICEWPQTLYELILPLANIEVAKPISYERGRVLITTHRQNHIDNMAKNIAVCKEIGLPVTVVMNNLAQNQAIEIQDAMTFRGLKCDYFLDSKYGLGYGITKAAIQSGSDYWLKIDDDDIYTSGHFFETYAALRIYQTRYCGRRISLYNFIEKNTLYAHKSGGTLPSLKKSGRHVSGACMSGLTTLLMDYEIPRYSAYNMDVAYSEYLESHNEARFIGSPFFLYVQRYDNELHTWRFDFGEWALNCVELGRMPFNLRDTKLPAQLTAEQEDVDICFLHRAIPGTIGYGAGTWVPNEAIQEGYNVSEIIVKEPKASDEPLVTNFTDRKFTRLHLTNIDEEYLSSAFDYYLSKAPRVFHVINMSEIGVVTKLLKRKFPSSKIIVEVRTPLLSNNVSRREDMCEALKIADNVITPSPEVIGTWLEDLSFTEVERKVLFVEPSINIPSAVNVKQLFAKTSKLPSDDAPLRLIYNGSLVKKRKINDMIASILPALERDEIKLTLCAKRVDFNKLYPALAATRNLNFVGRVSNTQMYDILSEHDALLAWLPQGSLYEEAWSTKIVEAALLGIDIIGSVTRGHQDMAARGLLRHFYDNEPNSFNSVLTYLRNQTKTTRDKDRRLARKAAEKFTWRVKVSDYKSVWIESESGT